MQAHEGSGAPSRCLLLLFLRLLPAATQSAVAATRQARGSGLGRGRRRSPSPSRPVAGERKEPRGPTAGSHRRRPRSCRGAPAEEAAAAAAAARPSMRV